MSSFVRGFWLACRRLGRAPGFTATVLVVLALGLGAATAMFSVVYDVLLRPLPYPQAGRLVVVSHSIVVPGVDHVDESDGTFLLYQAHNTVFDGIGAYADHDVNVGQRVGGGGEPARVTATGVSASLLPTLGIHPARGRLFTADDDRPGGPKVVLLSDALWRQRFAADTTLLGADVMIDGGPRRVVGIMPPSFAFPSNATRLWYPLQLDRAHTAPGSFNYTAVARLKPGVTAAAATAELTRILPRLLEEFPSSIPPAIFARIHLRPVIRPLLDVVTSDVHALLWIVFGIIGLVLAIACANVATLFLVRAEGRQRELAVRNALGAGARTLLLQHLNEALVLAAAGAVIGAALAGSAVRLLAVLPADAPLPRMGEVRVDAAALAFAAVAAFLCALVVSLVPVLRTRRMPLAAMLRDADRAATAGRERRRARSMLVTLQVALALVLVAGSGLVARSVARLRAVSPGFDATQVTTLRVSLPAARYATASDISTFYSQLLNGLSAIPGVTHAGLTTWLPLTADQSTSTIRVEDHPDAPDAAPAARPVVWASNDYFDAMGIPIRTGRTFGPQDVAHPPLEAIVSRSFADQYWAHGSALGRRIQVWIRGPWYTIVGVAGDVHLQHLDQPAPAAVYFPLIFRGLDSMDIARDVAVTIRSRAGAAGVASAARDVVRRLDPTLPTYAERPMAAIVAAATARTRFLAALLAAASAIALVLGAVGLYGVMAYAVSFRRREIGVRMALGARPRDVRRMISREGVAIALLGVIVGLGAARAAMRVLRSVLYGVSPSDPLTLAGTVVVLLAVAFAASWIPARCAAGIDPAVALRGE